MGGNKRNPRLYEAELIEFFRSKSLRTAFGVIGVVAAGIGLISDVLGLRSGEPSQTVVVTVPVSVGSSVTAPSETVPGDSSDPQVALEKLRVDLAAKASSGLIDKCGLHAVLATRDGVRIYEWIDSAWVEFTNALEQVTSAPPLGIQSIESAQEDAQLLLVSFDRSGSDSPAGGVLALGETGCESGFTWRYFSELDGSFTTVLRNLRVGPDGQLISSGTEGPSVEFRWDDVNRYYTIKSSTGEGSNNDTVSEVPSEITSEFIANYAKFTMQSFSSMLKMTEPGSPAERLVKFLLIGKQISRAAGHGEGAGFGLLREGDGYRIMTPGGGTFFDSFVGLNGQISGFRVNSIDLDRLIRLDETGGLSTKGCSISDVCVRVRGVHLGARSAYFAVEVDGSQTLREVKFMEASLETAAGSQRQVSATTPVVKSRPEGLWSLAFSLSDLPWGGRLTVALRIGNSIERVDLVIAS